MKAFSITALAILAAGAVAAGREEDAAEGRRLRGGIVISEATTRITGPLDVHGAVGYVAALNEHYGQGVTRENNAALAFWQAVGPRPVPPDDRQDYNAVLEAGNAFFDRQVEAPLASHAPRADGGPGCPCRKRSSRSPCVPRSRRHSIGRSLRDDGGRNLRHDLLYRPPHERLGEIGESWSDTETADDLIICLRR